MAQNSTPLAASTPAPLQAGRRVTTFLPTASSPICAAAPASPSLPQESSGHPGLYIRAGRRKWLLRIWRELYRSALDAGVTDRRLAGSGLRHAQRAVPFPAAGEYPLAAGACSIVPGHRLYLLSSSPAGNGLPQRLHRKFRAVMALVRKTVQGRNQFLRRDRCRVLERHPTRHRRDHVAARHRGKTAIRPKSWPQRSGLHPAASTSPSPRRTSRPGWRAASGCSMRPTLTGWRPCWMALAEKLTGLQLNDVLGSIPTRPSLLAGCLVADGFRVEINLLLVHTPIHLSVFWYKTYARRRSSRPVGLPRRAPERRISLRPPWSGVPVSHPRAWGARR